MPINETKIRSLLKAASFRVIEIALDSAILSLFVEIPVAVGLAIGLETICFSVHYIFERVWNRISYGRNIKEEK